MVSTPIAGADSSTADISAQQTRRYPSCRRVEAVGRGRISDAGRGRALSNDLRFRRSQRRRTGGAAQKGDGRDEGRPAATAVLLGGDTRTESDTALGPPQRLKVRPRGQYGWSPAGHRRRGARQMAPVARGAPPQKTRGSWRGETYPTVQRL